LLLDTFLVFMENPERDLILITTGATCGY